MSDPFKIEGPAVISFSGGRTSGYMLWRILQAHGGTLPADVRVVFANTGKERNETLDFVERCACAWGVPMTWLEYVRTDQPLLDPSRMTGGFPAIGCHGFRVVDYAAASRGGEPFDAVLAVLADYRREAKGLGAALPSRGGGRSCTGELKTRTMYRWLLSLGIEPRECLDAIGIRHDEPKRVKKILQQTASQWEVGEPVLPLNDARITVADVMAFWGAHPFDLQLEQDEGNCDLCFLKSKNKLLRLMRARPESVEWWAGHEERAGQLFRLDFGKDGYRAALRIAQHQQSPQLPGMEDDEPSIACHCTD